MKQWAFFTVQVFLFLLIVGLNIFAYSHGASWWVALPCGFAALIPGKFALDIYRDIARERRREGGY